MYILLYYVSVNGGINNLQVASVVSPAPFGGLFNIIKVFSSKKMLAEKRAERFINNLNNK